MPISTRDVLVVVRARDVASRTIQQVGHSFSKLDKDARAAAERMVAIGSGLTQVGIGIAAVGAAGLSILGAATSQAVEYQRQTALTATQVDGLTASIDELGQVGLRVATKVGAPLDQMQASLFDIFSTVDLNKIESAEYMLEQFAMAAVAGQAEMQSVGKLTMAVMNAFERPVSELTDILDVQFQMIRKGVGTYEDFAAVMGLAIPAAVAANQTFEEMAGSLAFMTRRGMSHSRSVTSLARAYEMAFSTKAIANLREIGVEVTKADGSMRSFADVIEDLVKSKGWGALTKEELARAIEKTFGRGTIQARRFFELAFDNIDDLQLRIRQMSEDAEGAMTEAFDIMQASPAVQLQLLKNAFQALGITIGQVVIPVLMPIVQGIRAILDAFLAMNPETRKALVLMGLIGSSLLLLGGLVITAAGGFMLLSGTLQHFGIAMATANRIILTTTGVIGGLVIVGALVIPHWDKIADTWVGIWETIADAVGDAMQFVARALGGPMRAIVNSVTNAMNVLQSVFMTGLSNVLRVVSTLGMAIYNALQRLNPFATFSPSLVDRVRDGVARIVSLYGGLSGVIPAIESARNAVDGLKDSAADLQAQVDSDARAELESYLSLIGAEGVLAYNTAAVAVNRLEDQLANIRTEYELQTIILEGLGTALEQAKNAYNGQLQMLEDYQVVQEEIQEELKTAQRAQRDLTDALEAARDAYEAAREPLKAMEDDLKKLNRQLEIERRLLQQLDKELDAVRNSYTLAEANVDRINNAIKEGEEAITRFARAALKGTGAFSDKLFDLDQKAAKVRLQMIKWEKVGAPPEALDFFRYQLDQIGLSAEELRLKEKLELDPLRRELEKAGESTKELTFEEAMAGIEEAKAAIASLQGELPGALLELAKQEDVLAAAQEAYDKQAAVIATLEEAVSDLRLELSDAEDALQPYIDAIEDANDAIDDHQDVLRDIQDRLDEVTDLVDDQREAVELAQDAVDDATEAYRTQQDVLSDLEEAYSLVTAEVDTLRDSMQQTIDMARDMKEALDAAAEIKSKGGGAAGGGGLEEFAGLDALEDIEGMTAGLDDFELPEFDTTQIDEAMASFEKMMDIFTRFVAPVLVVIGLVKSFMFLWGLVAPIVETAVLAVAVALGIPIGAAAALIAVVAAIVGAFIYFWNTSESFRDFWKGLWDNIVAAVVGAWDNFIYPALVAIVKFFTETLWGALQKLGEVFATVWSGISTAVKAAWDNVIKPVWDVIYKVISTVLIVAFKTLATVAGYVWGFISEVIEVAWMVIKPIFHLIWEVIKAVLIWGFHTLRDTVKGVWDAIKVAITVAWAIIKPIWEAMKWVIANVLVPIFNTFLTVGKRVFEGIWNALKIAWSFIEPVFKAIVSWIGDTLIPRFQSFWDFVVKVWDGIRGSATTAWDGIKNAIKSALNGAIGFVERFINNLISAFNKSADVLDFVLGPVVNFGKLSSINIPRLAGGGMIQEAGKVLVGEYGPEVLNLPVGASVRPLSTEERYRPNSGGGNVEVNIQEGAFQFNGPIDSASIGDVERLLTEFQQELVDELRSR